jgi:hypothetical protein
MSAILKNTKKVSFVFLLALSALAAYATLGDRDGRTKNKSHASLLSGKTVNNSGTFSLKSGYTYRGNQVFTQHEQYINLNTTISYQKGRVTYVLPLRKRVLLNKVTFNPNASTRN